MRWGVLGAADIADKALLPAMRAASGSEPLAIASRSPRRAQALAARHGVPRVHATYDHLLEDPDVDAVYLPLTNDAHKPWTLRALAAGKHVLCEKPLALNAGEGEEMAAAARSARRLLMEAFMYRFHPRMRGVVASMAGREVRHVQASFGFTLKDSGNYRARSELGGGALYDVGCYCIDVARWLLGEPDQVRAFAHGQAVDMTTTALLHFPSGATASVWASMQSPEHQVLEIVTADEVVRVEKPFTAMEPVNPYQVMVEEFAAAAQSGGQSPLPLEWSIANLRVLDRAFTGG
ncbi:MAG TPA: Gfo/Idh/MocA family oxidoreductase [Candidatus Dormibacteraeota bacterium]